jgi:hypothetical protein
MLVAEGPAYLAPFQNPEPDGDRNILSMNVFEAESQMNCTLALVPAGAWKLAAA